MAQAVRRREVRAPIAIPLLGAALVLAGLAVGANSRIVSAGYMPGVASAWWVTNDEWKALGAFADLIPPGSSIAADPFRGAGYLPLQANVRMTFPTEKTLRYTSLKDYSDKEFVGASLVDITRSPQVCAAAQRLGVDYVITGGDAHWSAKASDVASYQGLDSVKDDPDFPVVAEAGGYELHAVPAC
jgi:hypothetical protein